MQKVSDSLQAECITKQLLYTRTLILSPTQESLAQLQLHLAPILKRLALTQLPSPRASQASPQESVALTQEVLALTQ